MTMEGIVITIMLTIITIVIAYKILRLLLKVFVTGAALIIYALIIYIWAGIFVAVLFNPIIFILAFLVIMGCGVTSIMRSSRPQLRILR